DPPVLAVGPAHPVLAVVGPAAVHGAQVGAEAPLEVVGVDAFRPPVVLLSREGAPREGEPPLVEVAAGAVGSGRPEADGGVVEEVGRAGGRHQRISQSTTTPRDRQGPGRETAGGPAVRASAASTGPPPTSGPRTGPAPRRRACRARRGSG